MCRLRVNDPSGIAAASGLNLASSTFPALSGLSYTPCAVNTGYAWYASSVVTAVDPKSLKVTSVGETVILYIVPSSSGKASAVTASVGRGDFATLIESSTQ